METTKTKKNPTTQGYTGHETFDIGRDEGM
jgi:hypothetical protein